MNITGDEHDYEMFFKKHYKPIDWNKMENI